MEHTNRINWKNGMTGEIWKRNLEVVQRVDFLPESETCIQEIDQQKSIWDASKFLDSKIINLLERNNEQVFLKITEISDNIFLFNLLICYPCCFFSFFHLLICTPLPLRTFWFLFLVFVLLHFCFCFVILIYLLQLFWFSFFNIFCLCFVFLSFGCFSLIIVFVFSVYFEFILLLLLLCFLLLKLFYLYFSYVVSAVKSQ